ncbi:tyrosine-type recombinase/integrase [Nonomuraea sp. M3C6]|uniref:Tyrosine-type recombinase/integrase n=1 Tax=Nonomuraea marmarensis TaxID=3351344 RepID=A0ABW7AVA0_9ACTN
MHRHDPPEARVGGSLAVWAAGFAADLTGRGYSWSSVKHHLHLMADLSAWLAEQGLVAEDLTQPVVDRFCGVLRARGSYLVKATSMEPLLGYLRNLEVLPPHRADGLVCRAGVLLQEYERYLRVERRAREVTIIQYLRYAAEFLTALSEPSDGPGFDARLPSLDGAQVLDVVSRQIVDHRLPSVGAVLTGDRAFLRFLERTGRTTPSLADAVPAAARGPSRLPEQVDPGTAAAILGSCNRTTEGGCRDHAVLLLLHRYGLRPVEVARLELPDLRWRAGEFVVHGKAGRVDVLPLLHDVGEAIVEYLRIRRAAPPGVAAVFLSARAPVQPMRKNSIGALVERACARAGVTRVGPRAFRHALGHDLLKRGASLVEIRDVLRHRDIDTTTAYTRVDVSALRPLVRPWPGSGTRGRPAQEALR